MNVVDIPLGWTKMPLSTPALRARLKRESNWASLLVLSLLLALTYFFKL